MLYANYFRWVQECGEIFRAHKSSWGYLVPTSPHHSAVLVEHFFNCACSLMAIQIREAVQNSLNDFVEFFQLYEVKKLRLNLHIIECFKLHTLDVLFYPVIGRQWLWRRIQQYEICLSVCKLCVCDMWCDVWIKCHNKLFLMDTSKSLGLIPERQYIPYYMYTTLRM